MITANDLLPTIKKLAASYRNEIGGTDSAQDSMLFVYLTNALRELVHIAYQESTSDALSLSADGYVTFQKDGVDITDLYSTLRINSPSGRSINKRSSFEDYLGWWRESGNTRIHIKGFTYPGQSLTAGNYTMDYLFYPPAVTSESSVISFPDAGAMGLCYWCAALIVESLPDPDAKNMAAHFYKLARARLKIAVQANIDARGISGGFVPSLNTVDTVFGGV